MRGTGAKSIGGNRRGESSRWRSRWHILIVALVSLMGCSPQTTGQSTAELPADAEPAVANTTAHEDLDATLWVQTSAEYAALTRMAFHGAESMLSTAASDPTWSAIPEQAEQLARQPDGTTSLPLAVILDVDETVLDNSAYQAQLIDEAGEYSRESWQNFVALACSRAIPGAKHFLDTCRQADITVFFVTNRDVSVEKHTRRNLEQEELIPLSGPDRILSKNERDQWTTDKTTRRNFVAQRYRVIALLGDDLNDFVWAGFKPTARGRREMATKYADYWGLKWFALPNPDYGGWERAVYAFEDALPHEQKIAKKRLALERPPSEKQE